MAKQRLNRANVCATLQEMRGKTVTKRMGRNSLVDIGFFYSGLYGSIDHSSDA